MHFQYIEILRYVCAQIESNIDTKKIILFPSYIPIKKIFLMLPKYQSHAVVLQFVTEPSAKKVKFLFAIYEWIGQSNIA